MPRSNTDAVALGRAAITELFTKIVQKIKNFLKIQLTRPGSQNCPMSGMLNRRRMQSGVALYSLAATAAMGIGWAPGGPKNKKIGKFHLFFKRRSKSY